MGSATGRDGEAPVVISSVVVDWVGGAVCSLPVSGLALVCRVFAVSGSYLGARPASVPLPRCRKEPGGAVVVVLAGKEGWS